MYLTDNAKKMLDAAISSAPTVQKRWYSAVALAKSFGIDDADSARMISAHLEREGAVVRWNIDPNCFQLTELGRNYRKYHFYQSKEFFKKSILCPIVVTIITEAVLHGVPMLLSLIQLLAQSHP